MNWFIALFDFLFPCRHKHVSWPMHGRQNCLDCSAFRFYTIGSKPSRWHSYRFEGHKHTEAQ